MCGALAAATASCLHAAQDDWGVTDMLRQLAGLAVCAACFVAPAFAQDKDMIVVTGQRMMQEATDDAMPAPAQLPQLIDSACRPARRRL